MKSTFHHISVVSVNFHCTSPSFKIKFGGPKNWTQLVTGLKNQYKFQPLIVSSTCNCDSVSKQTGSFPQTWKLF